MSTAINRVPSTSTIVTCHLGRTTGCHGQPGLVVVVEAGALSRAAINGKRLRASLRELGGVPAPLG